MFTSGKFCCKFCSLENLAGRLTINTIFLGDPFLTLLHFFKMSSLGEILSPKSNSHMPGRKFAMLGGCWKLHQNPPPDDIRWFSKKSNTQFWYVNMILRTFEKDQMTYQKTASAFFGQFSSWNGSLRFLRYPSWCFFDSHMF